MTPTSHHNISRHVTSRHITSHHITSHHITSHHITSHHSCRALQPGRAEPELRDAYPPLMSNFMTVFGFCALTDGPGPRTLRVGDTFSLERGFFRGTHVAGNVSLVTRMPSIVAGVCLCTWLSHLSDTHEGGRQHQHCRT